MTLIYIYRAPYCILELLIIIRDHKFESRIIYSTSNLTNASISIEDFTSRNVYFWCIPLLSRCYR